MTAILPSERLNAMLDSNDIRDVNAVNKMKTEGDMDADRFSNFVNNLQLVMNRNNAKQKARGKQKQGLWSVEEIRNNLIQFLRGGYPTDATSSTGKGSDAVTRIEESRTDYDDRGRAEYNATPEALVRLMQGRSSGGTLRRTR